VNSGGFQSATLACLIDNNAGDGLSIGSSPDGTNKVYNCVSVLNGGNDYTSGMTLAAGTNNASEDATAPGTSAHTSVSTTNGVAFVSPSTNDYTPVASGALDNTGADLVALSITNVSYSAVDAVGTARPQGASWDIGPLEAVSAGQTVTHSGQGTAAVYGSHTLANVAAQTAAPSGKASAAVFGTHTIGPAGTSQPISPTGQASAAVFGTHTLANVVARTLAPSGIASAAVYGSFTIANNAGVPSAAVYGTHQVADSGVTLIGHTGLASSVVYGTHAVANTVELAQPEAGSSAVAYGSHTLSIETFGMASPSGIASAGAFGTHIIADVVLAAAPAGLSSAARMGRHTLIGGVQKDFVSSVVLSRHRGSR
jgi:hypothetical protein